MKTPDFTILSVYIPHPSPACIPDLYLILSSLSSPIIVIGDFNCHHSMWGSHRIDSNALLLLELFDEFNVCLLNDGSPTRRTRPNENPRSAPDLCLCSPSLSSKLNWQVLPSSHGSDHFPILITMPEKSIPFKSFSPLLKYNLSNKNHWIKFENFLDSELRGLPPFSLQFLDLAYSNFSAALKSAADNSFPKKNISARRLSSPPWWDSECSAMIQKRDEAELRFSCDGVYSSFQIVAAQTKKLLSQKKKQGWLRFCENLSPSTPSCVVWRSIKRFRGSYLKPPDPSSNDPSSSWLHEFCNRIAPPWVPSLEECCSPSLSFSLPNDNSFLSSAFSINELNIVLSNLKDSSPGIDGFPYSFIVRANGFSKEYFLNLINSFFLSSYIPSDWRTQIIIPILKPGKVSTDSASYRPIALSSTLAKIMEHLLKNRLEWFLENKGYLAKSQFGFRKGLGTMDSLSVLVTDARVAFSKNENVIGVFLDISAAYDSVLLPVLRQKLQRLCIPERFTNFIIGLMQPRLVVIRHQGVETPPALVWRGLPQGSVLSPLLYNLYTTDLESSVNCFCNVLQYADDIALYYASSSIDEAVTRLNSAVHYLNIWLSDHGLSLSASKSSVVVFSRRRVSPDCSVHINSQKIPVCDSVKFLGVFLDSKMTFIPHLKYISEKCERNINILRALSGVWWGSHPFSQKILYNSIIRSLFDYGAFIIEPCSKLWVDRWDKIQYRCLRIICGAMKSSPTNALLVECAEPPLILRRQLLSDRFLYRSIQSVSHPLLSKLNSLLLVSDTSYWTHKEFPCLLKSYKKFINLQSPIAQSDRNPLFETPFEALIYKPKVFLNIGLSKDSLEHNTKLLEILDSEWPGWLTLFTDASKLSTVDCVGAAVWIPKYRVILNYKCPKYCSVFTGEAIAILEAVRYVLSHSLNNSIILSDSLSCLQAILSSQFYDKSRFPVILNIKSALFDCHSKGINVALAWIPAHCGISGNEMADSLARDAIDSGSLFHFRTYPRDLVPLASSDLLLQWDNLWSLSRFRRGKHYSDIQEFIPSKPWFFKFKSLDKSVVSTICRLRLGHACTPVHLAKIRIRDSSLCECGLDEGTLDHIFFECNLNSSFYDLLPKDIPRPTNMKCLLARVFSNFALLVGSFIKSNKIKL